MKFLGSASLFPHVQGMFQEYFVMGERQCYPVAGDVTLGELAFAEPLAVALHGVNRGGDLLGKSVLITGAGTIGCLTVMAARLAGAAHVTVSDVLDRPLAQAKAVGADVTLRADRDADALATPQFDVAYEVSGNFAALKSCVAAAKRGGVVVQVGTLPHEPLPFVVNELMAKELDLRGAFRWGIEFDWAVDYLSTRRVDVRPLLSGQYPLQDAVAAFHAAADKTKSTKVQVVVELKQAISPTTRIPGGSMRSLHKLVFAAVAAIALVAGARRRRRPSSSGRTSTRRASRFTSGRCGRPERSRSAPTAAITSTCSRRRASARNPTSTRGSRSAPST